MICTDSDEFFSRPNESKFSCRHFESNVEKTARGRALNKHEIVENLLNTFFGPWAMFSVHYHHDNIGCLEFPMVFNLSSTWYSITTIDRINYCAYRTE